VEKLLRRKLNLMSHLSIKHPREHADVKRKAEEEKKQNAKETS